MNILHKLIYYYSIVTQKLEQSDFTICLSNKKASLLLQTKYIKIGKILPIYIPYPGTSANFHSKLLTKDYGIECKKNLVLFKYK